MSGSSTAGAEDVRVVEVERGSALLDRVEGQFAAMYDGMRENGLLLPLADGGAALWRGSIERTLGRLSALFVGVRGDADVVGFAHGSIRIAPAYLGGHRLGSINHVFVSERARGRGVGARLVTALERWIRVREVHSIELQVLVGNEAGIGFWTRMGYGGELLQMRKAARAHDGETG